MPLNTLKFHRDYRLVKKSGLFDKEFYLAQNPDVARLKIDPIRHYLERGWKEDRNPSETFNTRDYLLANKDVAEAGINPLVHFLRFGRDEKRDAKMSGMYYKNPRDLDFLDILSLIHPKPQQILTITNYPIDIVIPVFDRVDSIKATLESVIKNTEGPYRLLICDDHCSDFGIIEYLTNVKDSNGRLDISIITNEQHLGYVKTVNRLIELTVNHFVILLPGTIVPPNWLPRLMLPIIADHTIASASPFSNSNTICGFPDLLTDNGLFMDLDIEKLDGYFQRVDFERNLTKIPAGVGMCMGVNREAFEKTGKFNGEFNDGITAVNEWCMRAAKVGFSHVQVPNLFVSCGEECFPATQQNDESKTENSLLRINNSHESDLAIKAFTNRDPLADLRKLMKMVIYGENGHSQVVLDHSWGGGANEYPRRISEQSDLTLVIAAYDDGSETRVIQVIKNIETESFRLEDYHDIRLIIEILGIRKIVINELVAFSDSLNFLNYLLELKSSINELEFSFVTHDYFGVCPSLNLLNQYSKFCNIPEEYAICEGCLNVNPLVVKWVPQLMQQHPDGMMAAWRSHFLRLLDVCSSITCFSNSSRELLLKAYPLLKTPIEVIPHEVDWVRPVKITKTSKRINVAVIGTLTKIKGAEIIVSLGRYLKENRLSYQIHIFGPVVEPYDSQLARLKSVKRHFAYVKSDLPELMEANEIDIVFISSICPETFSYTTQEAIEMGLPIATFDLGAPAERVKSYPSGLILKDENPKEIVNAISGFLTTLNRD